MTRTIIYWDRRCRDRIVVGHITTKVLSLNPAHWRGVLDTTL